MRDVKSVVARMCEAIGVKKEVDLAKYLELSASSVISTWKARGKTPLSECEKISQREGVSMDWLLTGTGDKYPEVGRIIYKLKKMYRAESDEELAQKLGVASVDSWYDDNIPAGLLEKIADENELSVEVLFGRHRRDEKEVRMALVDAGMSTAQIDEFVVRHQDHITPEQKPSHSTTAHSQLHQLVDMLKPEQAEALTRYMLSYGVDAVFSTLQALDDRSES